MQGSAIISRPASRYIREFDGLRAIAAISVIAGHAAIAGHIVKSMSPAFIAVRFFFVLSGFLITGILIDQVVNSSRPGQSLKAFYARRCLRIFPPYFAFLIFFLAIGNEYVWKTIAWTATYTSNFCFAFVTAPAPPLSHFWTLAVEEQFYLIWPLAILLLFRKSRNTVIVFMLALITTSVIYRIAAANGGASRQQILHLPIASLDSLVFGALIASLFRVDNSWAKKLLTFMKWTGLLVAIPVVTSVLVAKHFGWAGFPDLNTTGQLFVAVASGAVVIHFASVETNSIFARILRSPVARFLGMISYGIYIYHFPFDRIVYEQFLMKQFGWPDYFPYHFGFVLVATIITASISWYLLERPLLRLKSRFPYSDAGHQVANSDAGLSGNKDKDDSETIEPDEKIRRHVA
ncbi:MAG: acyltransferase [Planctomycetota bacterium]